MLKTIFITLVCLLFAGCAANTDGWTVNTAQDKCKEHKGIDYIDHVWGRVTCNNGNVFDLRTKIIKQ